MRKPGQRLIHLLIASALCLITACAPVTPNYDARFGAAVRDSKMAMTISPNAGSSQDPVAGMDGKASREALIHYQNSFKTPPTAVNVINLGGAIAR